MTVGDFPSLDDPMTLQSHPINSGQLESPLSSNANVAAYDQQMHAAYCKCGEANGNH